MRWQTIGFVVFLFVFLIVFWTLAGMLAIGGWGYTVSAIGGVFDFLERIAEFLLHHHIP